VRLLVVGSIHGNETAGHAAVRALRRTRGAADDIELWTVRTMNPDGVARRTRQNVHGVDLNRNFGHRWRGQGRPWDPFHSGRRPFSEPESRAARRLIERVRPDVTIWYHQALRMILGSGADRRVLRAYARRSGLRPGRIGFLPGIATRWQNDRFPASSAFVVELPRGPLSLRGVRRHAQAALAAARAAAAVTVRPTAATKPTGAAQRRPPIVQWPIPFDSERKRQMRAYASRHYGIDSFELRRPRAVVLHLSVSDTARSVYDTFAPNRPDPELGELPGVCAHFVVGPRGRIHQFVSLRVMCRHTVGLNHVAIGIEHVGRSESQVFARGAQLRSSLRLASWLQERFGIRTRDVIGHNESLSSPYHRERVRRLRRQTHGDFPSDVARRYRRLLSR
jgi:beta-N-acetylhexosaminidase